VIPKAISFKRPFSTRHRPPRGLAIFPVHPEFCDVKKLLSQRGIDVSYETIRCWTLKFGPKIARNLKRRRHPPSPRWRLDEMVVKVRGRYMCLWHAVDEGEILDMIMRHRRAISIGPPARLPLSTSAFFTHSWQSRGHPQMTSPYLIYLNDDRKT
jgi:hypothetical protein